MILRRKWFLILASMLLVFPPMALNSASVMGQAKGTSKPFQDVRSELWSRKTLADLSDETGEPELGLHARPLLEAALDDARKKPDAPFMPGGIPVANGGLVFYRTYAGITSVCLVKSRQGDREVEAGSVYWRSTTFEGSLGNILDSHNMRSRLHEWIDKNYKPAGLMNLLCENSTAGALSADSRNVYAVDDLALPIPPKYLEQDYWNNSRFVGDDLKKLVKQNRLKAYNIPSGKIEWELGGDSKKIADYANSHFLCAPLSVDGKLYVLNEKNTGDLRLLCLDPDTGKLSGGAPLELGTVKNEHLYYRDMLRRANGIRLAYADGILACPTHAAGLFGVDIARRTLQWIYSYQPVPAPAPPNLVREAGWKFPAPFIGDGKLVFTAVDDDHVHCLDLQNGKLLWKIKQGDDLYVAGIARDKVLVVGAKAVRALALKDGVELWKLEIGQPAGQGVFNRDAYLVPLKSGATSKRPEIAYVDVEKGRLLGTSPFPTVPGNLVMHQDVILSQSPTAVTAYGKGKGK
jgi:outer membrane protein assembly factor BamB